MAEGKHTSGALPSQLRPRIYVPAYEPKPVWVVDRIGDVLAALVIGAMIPLIAFATTWELWV